MLRKCKECGCTFDERTKVKGYINVCNECSEDEEVYRMNFIGEKTQLIKRNSRDEYVV